MSAFKPTIISGMAYGIDIEAHRAAMQFDLPTIAVLGSSVNKIYPAIHQNTAMAIMVNGGLMSEYAPGSEMHPSNFPQRNRIIAGLSDAVIVVEAAKKGGALITAEIAYSYNKEVFAVPGNLQSVYSEGCNNLIRTMKASIYTGPKDLEESLSWSKQAPNENQKTGLVDWDKFDKDENKILELLKTNKEIEIDQLAFNLELPISLLASKLLNLEFEGIIKPLPGKKYRLV
jgi:DNA processing protein